MSGDDDILIDDDFDEDVTESDDDSEESAQLTGMDARRRVENRLEELRMKKLLDDYDFDFD